MSLLQMWLIPKVRPKKHLAGRESVDLKEPKHNVNPFDLSQGGKRGRIRRMGPWSEGAIYLYPHATGSPADVVLLRKFAKRTFHYWGGIIAYIAGF